MINFEQITVGTQLNGISRDKIYTVESVKPIGNDAIQVVIEDAEGKISKRILYTVDLVDLSIVEAGRAWGFDADPEQFKLGLEAYRIRQAALFDPYMAIHTSNIEPLPHQIEAVYSSMLPKQPLRYVLADDPGAGKTIMAGLLIKELMIRADARRILIVAPGSLSEQWQDELLEKFGLSFEVFNRTRADQSASGNYFNDVDQLICRLDQLSRSEDLQEKLEKSDWDLIIVDEAHKLSASYYGQKIKKTKRFQLGEKLGGITRHFLLMTATPHNGKDEDFQIWLSLLDSDRFYGKFREGTHHVDTSDIMRRMVKEDLIKFDGTPLFPERIAKTVSYELSKEEEVLYSLVTDYVKEGMNRADKLKDGRKKGNVGFALTILQRRLASSPEAIYQSLKRRKKKLEKALMEAEAEARGEYYVADGGEAAETYARIQAIRNAGFDDFDEDEYTAEELEALQNALSEETTAAESIPELKIEIEELEILQTEAKKIVESGKDRKWDELSALLQNEDVMKTADGSTRKLIIFTEHKDTLHYLVDRISDLKGSSEHVRKIYGGTNRDERRRIQEEFRYNPDVHVLVATDAAGEGVNLQNANLMVNYDLPWNPNRLEQRFGRIHRIGQTEVCYLWNIVAKNTREGEVFQRLFDKLDIEREALGGKVYDILGEAINEKSLRELLIEAIRYGEREDVKARMHQVIETSLDRAKLMELHKQHSLEVQNMNRNRLLEIKEEMDRYEARKLQPHFIESFFKEAFESVGGQTREREKGRYEIPHVPATIRERDRKISETRTPVLNKYERVTFDRHKVRVDKKKPADFLHPMHPLMHALTDIVLEKKRDLFKQATVLVDPISEDMEPYLLLGLEHSVYDSTEKRHILSKEIQFVKLFEDGSIESAHHAPHLDLIPFNENDRTYIQSLLKKEWLSHSLEERAIHYAAEKIAKKHYLSIKELRKEQAVKILEAVHERLVSEINYQTHLYQKLQQDVLAGKSPRVTPIQARQRAEKLTARLKTRTEELNQMQEVVNDAPLVVAASLVVSRGWLEVQKNPSLKAAKTTDAQIRKQVERIAMKAVQRSEELIGCTVKDVSAENLGWDITSTPPSLTDNSVLPNRLIEVKGRMKDAETITITKNEMMTAYNKKEQYILAIVLVDGDSIDGPYYIREPFDKEPSFAMTNANFNIKELLAKAITPEQSLNH